MRKNEQFVIEITGMTDNGEGVGRAEGMAVFVPYTIVGETVQVHIVKVMKRYAMGKLVEVLKPSPSRMKAECPHFYQCGGCQLWHMSYAEELAFKKQKVVDCLRRIGGMEIPISSVIGADTRKHYRNKSQFPVTPAGIGMYAGHSHRLVTIDQCMIQSEKTEKIISTVRYWMTAFGIVPYDEQTGEGQVRHLYTRETDEGMMVCLVTRTKEIPHLEALIGLLKECGEPVRSLLININEKQTNVILGNETITVWGSSKLSDHLGDSTFSISPASFYQVNKQQMKKLYDQAGEYAGLTGEETVWDIYCGIGTIGQYLAKNCKKILGIEIVEDAVENARENARLNKLQNTAYVCGSAEQIAPKMMRREEVPDVVILDPPRKGCDQLLLDTITGVNPKKIVYISCKPATLARDLKYLHTKGYVTQEVTPVDMFPATAHVEVVALVSKRFPYKI